jgi:hypothetical protein
MRCMLMRSAREIHAEIHAYEMHAYEMHAYETHARFRPIHAYPFTGNTSSSFSRILPSRVTTSKV